MEAYGGTYSGILSGCHHLQFFVFLLGVVHCVWVEVAEHRIYALVYHLIGHDTVHIEEVQLLDYGVECRQLACKTEFVLVVGESASGGK